MRQGTVEHFVEEMRLSSGKSRWIYFTAFLIVAAVSLMGAPPAFCSAAAMRGPVGKVYRQHVHSTGPETSTVKIVFLGAIDFYLGILSPARNSRCGFYPSCSTFGRQAINQYGVIRGVMMTGDRLTRCNIFKKPGPDYFLLPDGKLFDPLSANTLTEQ